MLEKDFSGKEKATFEDFGESALPFGVDGSGEK